MSSMIGNADSSKTLVQCALCNKEVELKDTYQIDKHVGLILSCGCRCAQCPSCGKPAMDVSDTASEIMPMCSPCGDFDDGFDDEMNMPSPLERRQFHKWLKSLPKAYTLDERFRKDHPKAYTKWTDDERASLGFFYAQGKTRDELATIFQRQPHVISTQAPLCANSLLHHAISEASAIRMLGSKIVCTSCQHQTILTYLLLERIASKLSITVLALDKGALVTSLKFLKCTKCGAKTSSLP